MTGCVTTTCTFSDDFWGHVTWHISLWRKYYAEGRAGAHLSYAAYFEEMWNRHVVYACDY